MPIDNIALTPRQISLAASAARASYLGTAEEIAPYLTPFGLAGGIQPFARGESEGFVYQDAELGILAFRGSQTLGDWLYNANVELTDWEGEGRVHKGFLSALDACWALISTVTSQLAASRKLIITGHSLGGAMAMLAAERLRKLGSPADAVVMFGNPKVGDSTFAEAFSTGYATRCCSVLNHGDPVPWLPMLHSDFTVAGDGIFFTSGGDLQARPPQWQAMLMLVGGLLSDHQENLLELRPHSKDEYLRLSEEHFGQG